MKLTIDKEADALYLDLDETPAVESEEISPGVILDYNSEGKVTGIEPESAAADVDRSPQRPNALLVQTRSVLAVGKSRGRAAGAVGRLLKFGLSGGAREVPAPNSDTEGFLITAYPTDAIKEGEHIWPI